MFDKPFLTPHPCGNSSFDSYFPFQNLAFKTPSPQPLPPPVGIPTTPPPWTEDGHFLGPQFVSFEISYTYKRFPAKYVGIETEPVLRDVQSAMH